MSSHNGPTTQSSEAPASDWSALSSERPQPDAETGKVMRTIWNWETRVWEHEPSYDPEVGMTMYTAFDWEESRWEHGYSCGLKSCFDPCSFASLGSLPVWEDPLIVPPPWPPTRLPSPHPVCGRVINFGFNTYTATWVTTYEDGSAVPVSAAKLEEMFPGGLPW
ncbi:hypothetical protein KCU67_g4554, partial [Aureobasidium melanogenum]